MILGGAEGSSGTGVVPLVGAISSIIEGGIDEIGTGIVAMDVSSLVTGAVARLGVWYKVSPVLMRSAESNCSAWMNGNA